MGGLDLGESADDRRRFRMPWVAVVSIFALAVGLVPSAAVEAQPGRIFVEGTRLGCEPFATCDPVDGAGCDGGEAVACQTLPNGSHVCSPFDGGFGETICCSEAADCGVLDGVVGRCASLEGALDGPRVCIWDGIVDYCTDGRGIAYVDVLDCLSLGDGAMGGWANGDCDGDSIKNAEDECPCDDRDACFEPPRSDGGVPIDDGGVTVDAGWPDTGAPVPDASPPEDSGSPPLDTGTPPTGDASAGDDGGDGSGVSFTGDGGCSTSPTSDDAGGLAWLLVGLALVLRRRR